jgi:hypothetical protein
LSCNKSTPFALYNFMLSVPSSEHCFKATWIYISHTAIPKTQNKILFTFAASEFRVAKTTGLLDKNEQYLPLQKTPLLFVISSWPSLLNKWFLITSMI